MVGKAMDSNEDDAYTIMQELGVDYVLIIFGGLLGSIVFSALFSWFLGYSGDDINKFLWMVRIAEGKILRIEFVASNVCI